MVLNFICDRPAMINNGGAGVIRTLIPARGVRVTAGYRHQSLQLLQKLTKCGAGRGFEPIGKNTNILSILLRDMTPVGSTMLYPALNLVDRERIELSRLPCKGSSFPLAYRPKIFATSWSDFSSCGPLRSSRINHHLLMLFSSPATCLYSFSVARLTSAVNLVLNFIQLHSVL